MATQTLFDQSMQTVSGAPVFAGAEYDETRDRERLTTQIACVHAVVIGGGWWTVEKLTKKLRKDYPRQGFPETSVSAQLRNLKKLGFQLFKRNLGGGPGGLWEYQILPPTNPGVGIHARIAAGVQVG